MTPVQRALWTIETRLFEEIALEDIASASGVSAHHLCRAFAAATGETPMRHLRDRRITEAAKQIARGAPDILSVALGAGYGSHEAFARAFRDRFACPPSAVRAGGTIDTLTLTEAIDMTTTETGGAKLAPPRMIDMPAMRIAGLAQRVSQETLASIPALWARFAPHIGHVEGQADGNAYGVCIGVDAEAGGEMAFDYMAGIAVRDGTELPEGFAAVGLPAGRYAAFLHEGHVSGIRHTWNAILSDWLPGSGLTLAKAPDLEIYDERFDPMSGTGTVEIRVPVEG